MGPVLAPRPDVACRQLLVRSTGTLHRLGYMTAEKVTPGALTHHPEPPRAIEDFNRGLKNQLCQSAGRGISTD